MRHLLVPTDFSDTARAAQDLAIEMARSCNARVTLLHVLFAAKLEEQLAGLDALRYLSATRDVPSEEWQRFARTRLDEAAKSAGMPIAVALAMGRPSTAIVDFARQNEVDMIVMGTHGRGPVARFFIGSVAENVIRSADCPVTVMRHPVRK